tara:strand:- start:478 stop:786 length:309 start_codon:yes stop_codon:yes gene_type:complete
VITQYGAYLRIQVSVGMPQQQVSQAVVFFSGQHSNLFGLGRPHFNPSIGGQDCGKRPTEPNAINRSFYVRPHVEAVALSVDKLTVANDIETRFKQHPRDSVN